MDDWQLRFNNFREVRRVFTLVYESSYRILERSSGSSTTLQSHFSVYYQRTISSDITSTYGLASPKLGTAIVCVRQAMLAYMSEQLEIAEWLAYEDRPRDISSRLLRCLFDDELAMAQCN